MKEIKKEEELRLRKRAVKGISTTYSRRPKKAKTVEEPESEVVKTPESEKVPETPKAPTVTFSRKKSIPCKRKFIKAEEVVIPDPMKSIVLYKKLDNDNDNES
ncbi:hypothetical protein L1987_40527 [Smallanthus sonchifolius]|uniref:Uncharacterized protein n=1 Tax=Smallanthus sonchifolius TaxID=185202 RepID=A0ACB9GTF0_9ASTR|nr:hypothetical protein L1987_40527 [Smallanthus sonchifolius]